MSAHAERRSAGAALAALGAAALGWLAARRASRTADVRRDRAREQARLRLAEERRHYASIGDGEELFEAGGGEQAQALSKGRPLEGVEPGTRR